MKCNHCEGGGAGLTNPYSAHPRLVGLVIVGLVGVGFGKGSVQELIDITADTALKLTVARWLGPSSEPIPHSGIVPDYEVTISEEDAEAAKDPQMDKALEILR